MRFKRLALFLAVTLAFTAMFSFASLGATIEWPALYDESGNQIYDYGGRMYYDENGTPMFGQGCYYIDADGTEYSAYGCAAYAYDENGDLVGIPYCYNGRGGCYAYSANGGSMRFGGCCGGRW